MALLIFAVILTSVVVLSIPLNSLIIIVFLKTRQSRHDAHRDFLILSLAVSDILQALFGYPAEIRSLFNGELQDAESAACKFTAFAVTFFGLTSINHLVFMMIKRACIVLYPFGTLTTEKFYSYVSVTFSWLISFVFALIPWVSWSGYGGTKDRCSINWKDGSLHNRIYLYILFGCQFVLPFLIIIICYFIILKVLRKSVDSQRSRNASLPKEIQEKLKKNESERKAVSMVVLMTSAYLIAWTPYAIISLMTINMGDDFISQNAVLYISFLAKSSTLCNPVIYAIYSNKEYRMRMIRSYNKWRSSNIISSSSNSKEDGASCAGGQCAEKFDSSSSSTGWTSVQFADIYRPSKISTANVEGV
ncbi:blue-sensitive opsin-like [Clytia hemisphaerica]|uniref:blue-sensitive opsin-like n=1 Tax=Clytia hemisphaerica TaxID=252671 RepID=UPI0034D3AFBA|eukprot:TCONS_00067047-protein